MEPADKKDIQNDFVQYLDENGFRTFKLEVRGAELAEEEGRKTYDFIGEYGLDCCVCYVYAARLWYAEQCYLTFCIMNTLTGKSKSGIMTVEQWRKVDKRAQEIRKDRKNLGDASDYYAEALLKLEEEWGFE